MKTNLELAAPELLEALKDCLSTMEMQERRDSGEFHISGDIFFGIWSSSKDKARAAIALAEQPEIDPVTKLPFNRD